MNRLMILAMAALFCMTTSVLAQSPAAKIPTAAAMKETLRQDVKEMKKDAKEIKDAVEQGVRQDIEETKESVKELKGAVKGEVKKSRHE